jgi:hypothetical protein
MTFHFDIVFILPILEFSKRIDFLITKAKENNVF